MANQGFYGNSYDRYVAHNEQSTLHKMKETYWTTKQAVIKKLGKREDAHVVASDQQLDSKLEVFRAIQQSCMDLLKTIERYQDRLCGLSQEENAMGRFLKAECQRDKTRAGKIMAAVGKAQSFSSQQRLALRVPLVRLYQEVETFRYRAISDTLMTVNRMESARTEYRGALLWMKDVSEELDPDTFKQLEKFRKVQAQVKKTKAKFDKLKLDTMQKIDLLAASRCNMFSHVLANYQTTLLHFWEKTSRTMTAVAESFKGYQYYEFNMLKELAEPSKKLAEETGNREVAERDTDGLEDDDEGVDEAEEPADLGLADQSVQQNNQPDSQKDFEDILGLYGENEAPQYETEEAESNENQSLIDWTSSPQAQSTTLPAPLDPCLMCAAQRPGDADQGESLTADSVSSVDWGLPKPQDNNTHSTTSNSDKHLGSLSTTHIDSSQTEQKDSSSKESGVEEEGAFSEGLIDLDTSHGKQEIEGEADSGSLNNLLDAIDKEMAPGDRSRLAPDDPRANDPFMEFGEETDLEEIKRKQEEQFDFSGKFISSTSTSSSGGDVKKKKSDAPKDLLSEDLEQDDSEKDDITLLNEILNAPTSGGDDFTREWQAVFGQTPISPGTTYTPVETDQAQTGPEFMPSNLLDLNQQMSGMNLGGGPMTPAQQQQFQQQQQMLQQQQMAAAMAAGSQRAPQAGGPKQPQPGPRPKPKKGQKGDMSAWFSLFADLDPLANPDAIGRNPDEMTDA